jgi:hypothetical protein
MIDRNTLTERENRLQSLLSEAKDEVVRYTSALQEVQRMMALLDSEKPAPTTNPEPTKVKVRLPIMIIEMLKHAPKQGMTCKELAENLDANQSSVAARLTSLKIKGLVVHNRPYFSLNPQNMKRKVK